MKRKLTTYFALLLTALLLTGCSADTTPGTESSTPESSGQGSSESQTQGSETQGAGTQESQTQASGTQGSESQDANSQSSGNSGAEGSVTEPVSEEEAKKIALKHAGLTEDKVTFVKSGLDTENGVQCYNVEFYTADGKEYDYDIEVETGKIIDYDHDAEYHPQSSDTATGAKISEKEAKKIALDNVSGATERDIREFHLDYDNGKYLYEGKIFYNQKEYEFEIDGESGKITEWDEEPIQ